MSKKYRVTTEILQGYHKGEIIVSVDCDGEGLLIIPEEYNGIDKKIVERNPNWFEPVEQTPDIEINGKKFKGLSASGNWLEFDCGERIIKDQFDIFRAFVNIYDLKIYRHGEDITDQIKQIANYYND